MANIAHPLDRHAPRPEAMHKNVLLQFVELQVPMALGALACLVVLRLLPMWPALATAYRPGTYLFATGDALFLTVPVIAWMVVRGQRVQRCARMAVSMLAPWAVFVGFGELSGSPYLPWLTVAGYPALSLGMLAYLLYGSSEPN
jgi:hypothetical protein